MPIVQLDWKGCDDPDIPVDLDGDRIGTYPAIEGQEKVLKVTRWYPVGPVRSRCFVFDIVAPGKAVFRTIEELKR